MLERTHSPHHSGELADTDAQSTPAPEPRGFITPFPINPPHLPPLKPQRKSGHTAAEQEGAA